MKKIFTAIAAAALTASGMSAADFLTVTVDGTTVKNGDTVASSKLITEYWDEGELIRWEIHPDFTIVSSESASYTMTLTNAGETTFQFCGITGEGAMPGQCKGINAGQTVTAEGNFGKGSRYTVEYDYQWAYGTPLPEKLECLGHFKLEAKGTSGDQTMEFDVNMIYPAGEGSVDGIADEGMTLVIGNGRVASADSSPVEVYTLSGARVANEGLQGIYVVRAGGKAVKVAVK